MKRKSSERRDIAAKAITYEQRNDAIETARNAGYRLLECGPMLLNRQVIALNPADAKDVHLWFDWMTWEGSGEQRQLLPCHGYIEEEIAYEGVRRRHGLLRRYAELDIAPEEVSTGDRIALKIGEKVFSSQAVCEISAEPGLVAVENKLHLPQLAISAE